MKPLTILESPALPTIAEMVASDYRKASVFNQFGIDFCCGGKKTLEAVCSEKNINLAEVKQALLQIETKPGGVHWNFQQWDTIFLADFIVNAHHAYVRAQLPRVLLYGEKVARTHGQKWPETRDIYALVGALGSELIPHMEKEERVLFPYIKNLSTAGQYRMAKPQAPFGTVQNPIHAMESEHDTAGRIMHDIRRLSGGYTPPAGACDTFRVWYALLQEFEEDLHLHVHLENNILFPRAILSEKAALQQN